MTGATILIEAEAFTNLGGWVIDQQFMDEMGSPFLLAHGLGRPVADATTTVTFPEPGEYRVWVRTRDWVAPWKTPETPDTKRAKGAPGAFQVLVDGKALATPFGTEGLDWHWQDGGKVQISKAEVTLSLHDITGCEGRCDALLFSTNTALTPPDSLEETAPFRRRLLGLPESPVDAGTYDFVVVGGGIAGICAALSAARNGLRVALIQDRPILGGNNSSEVRVWLGGDINGKKYPRLGDLVQELEQEKRAHYGPGNTADLYEDLKKAALARSEPDLSLFLSHRGNGVETEGPRITAVIAQEIVTGEQLRFPARWVADCTGDGCIGYLAGADFEMTRKGHMGPSNLWNVAKTGRPASFPRCPWALDLTNKPFPGRGNHTGQPFDWLPEYRRRLDGELRLVRDADHKGLAPARRLRLEAEDWGAAARIAAAMGLRHAGVFADPPDVAPSVAPNAATADLDDQPTITLRAVLEQQGDYLVLETQVPLALPELPSQTPWYPGLDRLERHAQDLVGVRFTDHPHPHRWTRHQAWREGRFPLRADFPLAGEDQRRTQADRDYPFETLTGDGVYQIPVGPVHAGIIEPGHFRFHAEGETVLQLQARLGYVHKGIERLAVGRDPVGLARLAGRVSGDSTVTHTWAACQALERASGCEVPARALALRGLLCERERVANHIGDIGAICNDVGMAFIHMQCARLREDWQRASQVHFGHRLLMDRIIPGGVAVDLDAAAVATLHAEHEAMRRAIVPIFAIVDDLPSLADRLLTTGHLQTKDARTLGCTGYVAKASGLGFDLRRDAPYPPYDALAVEVPVQQEGDVAARVRVRMQEVRQSLNLMDELLRQLPDGPIAAEPPAATAGAIGLGLVEGWRGEVLAFVRLRTDRRIARYFARDPSWFTWPALEQMIHGNIVPDFPVCNKSVNASYSGQDL